MSARVAAIDCGTNSIRLLIADGSPDGRLVDVHREMRIVRLGQDVDRTGRLAPDALRRTAAALADYAAAIDAAGAERVRMVATSATRDATNRDEFRTMVRAVLGTDPEVVTGRAEAELSYTGALAALDGDRGAVLVLDVGGGSSELVRGGDGPLRAHSMAVGSVRMTERHFDADPPSAAQVEAVVSDVRVALAAARADVPLDADARLVGVAGTATTVAALALGLTRYDPDVLDGATVSAQQVRAVTSWLTSASRAERAAEQAIHPGRVDVIIAGALVLCTAVEEIGAASLTVSEHDILDGVALSLL